MSLPSQVVMKTDKKLNFTDASNVVLGSNSGYSAIVETSYNATGGNKEYVSKQYNIVSNNL